MTEASPLVVQKLGCIAQECRVTMSLQILFALKPKKNERTLRISTGMDQGWELCEGSRELSNPGLSNTSWVTCTIEADDLGQVFGPYWK